MAKHARLREVDSTSDPAHDVERPDAEGAEPPAVRVPLDIRSVALTTIAVVAAIWLLRYAQDVLIPFVLAVLISFALGPVVSWLVRRRLPRSIAVVLVLAATVGTVGATAYTLQTQVLQVIESVPDAARKLRRELRLTRQNGNGDALGKVQQAAKELERTAAEVTTPTAAPDGVTRVQIEEPTFRASTYLTWGAAGVIGLLAQTMMIVFLVFFLLLAGDTYKRKLVKVVGPTLTKKKVTVQIIDLMNARIERFLIVQVFTSLLVAVATGFALWWIGLEQPGVWGLMAGIFNSIPYFGPVIVTGGLAVVGFVQFGTIEMALYVCAIALLITSLEGWLLTPALMGKVGDMSPAAVFVGLLFWSWMWGVAGMILAVPLMMAAKVICDHVEDMQWIGEMLGD
jgi:predicted PurR-regulated permease PerM